MKAKKHRKKIESISRDTCSKFAKYFPITFQYRNRDRICISIVKDITQDIISSKWKCQHIC